MRDKKGQLVKAVDSLSAFAIGIFIMIIVVFAILQGGTSIQQTVGGNVAGASAVQNATYNNMTALLGSVGQFANYSDLIVIIGILAVVILLVSTAFVSKGRR